MVESLEVEAVGGGADIAEPEHPLADDEPHAHTERARLHRGRLADGAGLPARRPRGPAMRSPARR